MAVRRWLLVLVGLAGLSIPWGACPPQVAAVSIGRPPGRDVLKWRIKEGQTFYQTQTTRTVQDMTIRGQNTKQLQEQTFYISWTPIKKDARGNWTVMQKIEGIKLKIDMGGTAIEYDSTRVNQGKQAQNPLAEYYQAIVGAEFTFTLNPKLDVIKVEGLGALVRKLGAANPALQPLVKELLTGCTKEIDHCFGAVPGEAKKKGDRWQKRTTLQMGPMGTYQTTYQYTYQGKNKPQKNLATITVEPSLKYDGPANQNGAGLPFKIQGSDLKSTRGQGVILFDMDQGRVTHSTLEMGMEGTLKIDIGGMITDVKLRHTQKRTDEISARKWAWARSK